MTKIGGTSTPVLPRPVEGGAPAEVAKAEATVAPAVEKDEANAQAGDIYAAAAMGQLEKPTPKSAAALAKEASADVPKLDEAQKTEFERASLESRFYGTLGAPGIAISASLLTGIALVGGAPLALAGVGAAVAIGATITGFLTNLDVISRDFTMARQASDDPEAGFGHKLASWATAYASAGSLLAGVGGIFQFPAAIIRDWGAES